MATTVSCDRCGKNIGPVGYRVQWIGLTKPETGEREPCGEYCSRRCLNEGRTTKRPDFDATRTDLQSRVNREVSKLERVK